MQLLLPIIVKSLITAHYLKRHHRFLGFFIVMGSKSFIYKMLPII